MLSNMSPKLCKKKFSLPIYFSVTHICNHRGMYYFIIGRIFVLVVRYSLVDAKKIIEYWSLTNKDSAFLNSLTRLINSTLGSKKCRQLKNELANWQTHKHKIDSVRVIKNHDTATY